MIRVRSFKVIGCVLHYKNLYGNTSKDIFSLVSIVLNLVRENILVVVRLREIEERHLYSIDAFSQVSWAIETCTFAFFTLVGFNCRLLTMATHMNAMTSSRKMYRNALNPLYSLLKGF